MRIWVYLNGDLGVGDAADVLIRLRPGDFGFDHFQNLIALGKVDVAYEKLAQ